MKKINWKNWKLFKKRVISRSGDVKSEPYLIRWNILSTPFFGIKIHKILVPDDDCLHDHPWSFISIILKGGYWETTKTEPKGWNESHENAMGERLYSKWYKPGSVLWRPNPFPHRLGLPLLEYSKDGNHKYQSALTLVITFRGVREWGFYTPTGWMREDKYTSSSKCE